MYRILLVDDEILVRDAIKENIDWQSMDCELVGDCENGKQAAEFVQEHPVDIVLTDILMPYMDGMELSHFLHDNYPDIVIVVFSGFGEFEYAKKAIQYGVSEYLLKPVTAMELTGVIQKMKEKVEQTRKEKAKMESLTKTSENYRENAQVIRSKTLEALVNCTIDIQKSLDKLEEMGITLSGCGYRVAVFDIDLYSGMYQLDMEKRQESALMAFVLFNISDEIVNRENAGIVYQEGNNRVCVLFQEKWSRNFNGRIKEICHEIQTEIRKVMGTEVSMAIGKWVKTLEELSGSHDVAVQALQYRYLLGGKPSDRYGGNTSGTGYRSSKISGQTERISQIRQKRRNGSRISVHRRTGETVICREEPRLHVSSAGDPCRGCGRRGSFFRYLQNPRRKKRSALSGNGAEIF